ncbi:hypothetical protein FHW58_004383 [Duganella sp. 1224]|uniref:ThiF family adenylyltransferase n=1 Tax=Duganella sp. 1224 TaxID=2587052 RepID=UPI0015C9D972|nr:ThiF family adenylyltransferase [Duganella sp. 1224]NYE63155.1 hypothetical protein [Duganella sp. 1224]
MTINVLIQDAIEILKRHPKVSNVHALPATSVGDVVVCADIDTNLASTWKAQGSTPSGVRPVETVEILFPSNYPQSAPVATLRADFDASLPHINPHKTGERVPPCIYQGYLLDALHSDGFGRLVVQLVDWLEKAGEGMLINPAQGWEPARRMGGEHIIDFDIEEIEKNRPRPGGLQLLRMPQVWWNKGTRSYARDPKPHTANPFTGRHLRELIESGEGTLAMCWPATDLDGLREPYARFQPDTVTNFAEMVERAEAYGCKGAIDRFKRVLNEAAEHLPFSCVYPIYIGLAVKRPYHLIGMTTNYEILLYRLQISIPQGILSESQAVAVPILSPVSTSLLRRTSGISNDVTGLRSTVLGCGSLGSKVALHITRAGFAPELLIDRGYFSSHNSARHTLTPNDMFFPGSKSEKIAELVKEFNPAKAPRTFNGPIQALPLDSRSGLDIVLDPEAIVVNTTASNPVRQFLSGSAFRSRTVEACLAELGNVGIMTLEGPGRNPSTSDLMALTYEKLRELGRLHAFKQDASNTLQVGVGCNSVTLPMPDTRISLIAASVGQALLGMHTAGLPDCGKISLGIIDGDGMSVQWSHSSIGATQIINPDQADGWNIRILAPAHLKIIEDVQRFPTVETGGIIVGRVSPAGREILITDVLPAPRDSVRSPAQFVLGTDGRDSMVNAFAESAGGILVCLGTWHSHLEDVGPSQMDRETADALLMQMQRLTVLLIHRPNGYSAVVRTVTA